MESVLKMKTKRVLQVVGSLNAGGMEKMILNYYKNINKEKIQFDFLIFTKGKNLYEDEVKKMGANVYKITPRRESPIKNRKELEDFFKNHSYDAIHIHQGITNLLPLKMAYKYKIEKRIVHNHGVNRKVRFFLYLYNEIYVKSIIQKCATDYFTCSKKVLNQLYTKEIIRNNKYFLCTNSIVIEDFVYNEEKRKEIRKKLNVEDKFVIGHVGTFTKPKNHKFLLKVFKEINEKYKNAVLLLAGTGKLEETIRQQAKKENIEEKIVFLGQVKNVNEIMQAMDFFVFPSKFEGLPVTLIEAQANGLKILASDKITEEVKLTENLEFISLKASPKKWAEKICLQDYNRNINLEKLKTYNIKEQAKVLEERYLKNG